jgi:heme-degrading monooxygenase HmoA
MIELFYRYRVHQAQARAFEHAYGSQGPWAELFAKHPGFRRSRLFRHKKEEGVYVSIDAWESRSDWDAFRTEQADAYARLDRDLRLLYLEEHLIGYYEGKDEYRSALDRLT